MDLKLTPFVQRVLRPSDRYLLSEVLNEASGPPIYSLSLLHESSRYFSTWSSYSHLFVEPTRLVRLAHTCVEAIKNWTDEKIRDELKMVFDLVDPLHMSPEPSLAEYPLPVWLFPVSIGAIVQSIIYPKYWAWSRNRHTLKDECLIEFDAAAILCIMHLWTTRGKPSDFSTLDTCEHKPDVVAYWSEHVKTLDKLIGVRTENFIAILEELILIFEGPLR